LSLLDTTLTASLGIDYPFIGGAMYPCSNPELVAAVSEAGGIGVLQPLTLVHVHGLEFREGVRRITSLTDKPIGMNVITGVPVSVIRTPHVEQTGTEAGPIARRLLAHPRTKHWMRGISMLRFGRRLRDNMHHGMSHRDYYLAGKSVAGVEKIEPVATVVDRFVNAARD
jgi:NAD(P)H-dependent flavin oxidoreductase YrpB (nitropropane dioxygenase family)